MEARLSWSRRTFPLMIHCKFAGKKLRWTGDAFCANPTHDLSLYTPGRQQAQEGSHSLSDIHRTLTYHRRFIFVRDKTVEALATKNNGLLILRKVKL